MNPSPWEAWCLVRRGREVLKKWEKHGECHEELCTQWRQRVQDGITRSWSRWGGQASRGRQLLRAVWVTWLWFHQWSEEGHPGQLQASEEEMIDHFRCCRPTKASEQRSYAKGWACMESVEVAWEQRSLLCCISGSDPVYRWRWACEPFFKEEEWHNRICTSVKCHGQLLRS